LPEKLPGAEEISSAAPKETGAGGGSSNDVKGEEYLGRLCGLEGVGKMPGDESPSVVCPDIAEELGCGESSRANSAPAKRVASRRRLQGELVGARAFGCWLPTHACMMRALERKTLVEQAARQLSMADYVLWFYSPAALSIATVAYLRE
jgi:hypothetical protein